METTNEQHNCTSTMLRLQMNIWPKGLKGDAAFFPPSLRRHHSKFGRDIYAPPVQQIALNFAAPKSC